MRALAVLLCLAGPAAAQGTATPGTFTLRSSLNADIRSTQPGVNRDANTDAIVQHMVEGLVAFREDTSVAPMLAERVVVSEDGRTYTFTLRDGVRFQNGAPLTSAEAAWSLRQYLAPATQWRCLPDFDGRGIAKIVAVEAPDLRTVSVTIEKRTALFLPAMARPECGATAILHPDSLAADGSWRVPVGTGPYKMGEWRRGQFIELERFDGYATLAGPRDGFTGGKAALAAKLRFIVIPDSSAAKAALQAGSIDMLSDVPAVDVPDLRARPGIELRGAPGMGLTGFLLQTRDPLLKDVRIRRALALSIDVDQIVESTMGTDARPNPSPVPSASPFHTAVHAARPPRDLVQAKRLLAEAGYRGQPIRMITNRRYPNVFDAAVAAQSMAAEAGIRIELDVLDWATQLDRYTTGNYQAMSFLYSARLDPSLSFEMMSGPKDREPRKVWEDPEALLLIAQSMDTTDNGARQAIFDDLQRRFMDQVPAIVLFNQPDYLAWRQGVQGLAPWASGHIRLWNVSK